MAQESSPFRPMSWKGAIMPQSVDADILIVGAGLAGAATAYHLARGNRTRIVLLEQEPVGGLHSSGRNASIVREHADDESMQPILAEGAAQLRRGELASFERRGVMLLGTSGEPAEHRFPRARGTGRWCPEDGTVDVSGLLQAYLRGQEIRFNTKVLGWERTGGGLRVRTTHGDLHCRLLVNAAGPWAGALGDLPLTPLNRHLFATGPLAWVGRDWPCVWDGRRGLYFRPESGGLLLCCCDETPSEPGDYREDPAVLERLGRIVASEQPGLGDLTIRAVWVGQRVFASDRKFVIGFDPRDDRVFHVAGLGGQGVTASYAVGRLAARLISGEKFPESEQFSPTRLLSPSAASWRFSDANRKSIG